MALYALFGLAIPIILILLNVIWIYLIRQLVLLGH